MNGGAFGENFPYSNFHDLNMDWIIQIAKNFLDQYTHIQQVIADGETSLQNLTAEGLQQLQEKTDNLETLLQEWYNEHSEDIANQLADALADLNEWYNVHQNYLDETLTNKIAEFNTAANEKAAETIASIPDDYTALNSYAHSAYNNMTPVNILTKINKTDGYYVRYTDGRIMANPDYSYTNHIFVIPNTSYIIAGTTYEVHITFWDKNETYISGTINKHFIVPANARTAIFSFFTADYSNIDIKWDWNYIRNNGAYLYESDNNIKDFNNALWNNYYIVHYSNGTPANTIDNMPTNENGILLTFDSYPLTHFAAHQIYIANSGRIYTRYYVPSINNFGTWISNNTGETGTLYNKKLTSEVSDDFAGNKTFDNEGMIIPASLIYMNRAYLIEKRTMQCLCKFGSDTIAHIGTIEFGSGRWNTRVSIDIANKTVSLNNATPQACNILNNTNWFLFTLNKNYQTITITITNMTSGSTWTFTDQENGPGGIGQGAIQPAHDIPMQHDIYSFQTYSGNTFKIAKISVRTEKADVVIYGDSITEPEGYFPSNDFPNSWTQLIIANSSKKVITAGRGGGTINLIYEAMKCELPYIGAKYCMVTIGTNGGNSIANLTTMVKYIKSCGMIPLLNHIPCYNNNGDTTGFRAINTMIDTVRENEEVTGCDFDKATSQNYDGLLVNTNYFWYEDYGTSYYYHHPNVLGSKKMYDQALSDTPQIF